MTVYSRDTHTRGVLSIAARLVQRARWLLTPWTLVAGGAVVVVAYLVLVPLFFLLQATFVGPDGLTLGGFVRAYAGNAAAANMMLNTLVYGAGSAAFALVLGTVLAYLQVRTDAPLKGLLFSVSVAPMIIPGILYTPAWIFLADPKIGLLNTSVLEPLVGSSVVDIYNIPGMIWVNSLHNAPIAFLLMVAAFRGMDPSLEESASMSGASRVAVLRRITVPLLRPALVGAALLLFVQTIESFEVPALLGMSKGIYVFTSRIFFETRTFPVDYGATGAYAFALLLIAVAAALLGRFLVRNSRNFQTISGKAFRPRRIRLGRARVAVGGCIAFYFFVTAALPAAVLVYASLLPYYRAPSIEAFRSMSLATYRRVAGMPSALRALENSLLLGVGAATAVMLLTSLVAWVVVRTRAPGRKSLDVLTLMPLVIPGLVLGLALLFVYLRVPLPIYGTLLILLVALSTAYLPYGMRFASAAITQVSAELEESALACGASRWRTFQRILLPLMSGGILAGWIYVLIHSFRSLSNIILLYSPGTEVLSVLLFKQYQNGEFTVLAAIGVVMTAILVVMVFIAYKVGVRIGVDTESDR